MNYRVYIYIFLHLQTYADATQLLKKTKYYTTFIHIRLKYTLLVPFIYTLFRDKEEILERM